MRAPPELARMPSGHSERTTPWIGGGGYDNNDTVNQPGLQWPAKQDLPK
jgi:hypothetical protein